MQSFSHHHIHIERYEIEIDRTAEMSEQTTNNIPNLSISDVQNLNEDGIVTIGTFVKPGDILNIDFSISNPLVTTPFLVSYLLIKYITIRQIINTKPIRSTKGIS